VVEFHPVGIGAARGSARLTPRNAHAPCAAIRGLRCEFHRKEFDMNGFRALLGALVGTLSLAPSAQAQSRGELLYSTHCIACHTSQMHWRDKKQVTDWKSLTAQVRRWQATAQLQWSDDDILEVARHLNERFYHLEQTSDRVSSSVSR
jgi:hypothetical protein